MNASELKANVEHNGHDRLFFTRDTMKFFGDTMKNYGVRATTIRYTEWVGDEPTGRTVYLDVWELFRRRPVKHGMRDSAFFTQDTFRRVFPAS